MHKITEVTNSQEPHINFPSFVSDFKVLNKAILSEWFQQHHVSPPCGLIQEVRVLLLARTDTPSKTLLTILLTAFALLATG